mgnify:CR=1 FL=1
MSQFTQYLQSQFGFTDVELAEFMQLPDSQFTEEEEQRDYNLYEFERHTNPETTQNLYRACSRVSIAVSETIGSNAFENCKKSLLLAEPNWRKLTTAQWIEKAKEWWLVNMHKYGYELPPALPAWETGNIIYKDGKVTRKT